MLPCHIFPYTNFHEINIDWLLQKVKGIEEWISQFDEDEIEKLIKTIINNMVEDGTFDEFFAEWVEPINTQLTDLTSRVVILETSQAAQDTNITALRTDLNALTLSVNTDIPNIFTQLDELDDLTASQQTALTNLQNNYALLNSAFTTFKDSATSELSDHEARISALENVEPVAPKWQTRNYIYGGNEYATMALLEAAIEQGTALIGDHAPVTLTDEAGVNTFSATVYVAKYHKNDGAFLLVVPSTVRARRIIDYGDTESGYSLNTVVDTIARRNASVISPGSNSRLELMTVKDSATESIAGDDLSVIGMCISAPLVVGYPAFGYDSGYYQNGKLPFVENYLSGILPILLSDNDTNSFAVWDNTDTSTPDGHILIKSDVNITYNWAFIVKLN
jgi:hypothetical protein